MADTASPTDATVEFRLPSLGSDMDSGIVLAWRVEPGATVRKGDVLLDVDTEKAEIEVEVWQDAVVAEILVAPGTEVPVGTPLALLRPLGAAPARAAEPAPAQGPSAPASAVPARPTPTTAPDRAPVATMAYAMPTPRTVYWSVPGVAAARPSPAEPAAPAAPRDRGERMRGVIANLMSRSNAEIPHYHLVHEVDLGTAMAWLEATNAERSVADRILPAALLLRAVALATRDHPEVNGSWTDDGFVPASGVHLGVAIHLRSGGLVTPAITDADTLGLGELMARLRDLVNRSRAGKLKGSEMTGSTLTVTNLGDQGVDAVLGVIHPPQAALVGVGRISERPAVVDGAVVARPGVTITLAADHRATDGHVGSRFLQAIAAYLQTPQEL